MYDMEHLKKLLPQLTTSMRKGSCGRAAIVGGSLEYTGAPYFAAISTLKLGGDLAHVFCHEAAATPIKTFSPSLIVHPGWDKPKDVIEKLTRADFVVMGPGMGRDPIAEHLSQAVFNYVESSGKPAVFDGDAIFWACEWAKNLPKLPTSVFTPNRGELDRMSTTFIGKKTLDETDENKLLEAVRELSARVGASIFVKGASDLCVTVDGNEGKGTKEGGLRRCGGQGDVVAGVLGLLLFWQRKQDTATLLDACIACSDLVRTASRTAFDRIGRSVDTPDIIEEIPRIVYEVDRSMRRDARWNSSKLHDH